MTNHRYATVRLPLTESRFRTELGFTRQQWQSLKAAADDASMELRQYIRLMLLCAAGHGGVIEHAERVVAASFKADKNLERIEDADDDMPIEFSW